MYIYTKLAAVATALAFVTTVLVIGSFGPKAFAQIVFPPSPPTFPPTRPSPSQQAIIHACANTAHSHGHPPFCPTLFPPPTQPPPLPPPTTPPPPPPITSGQGIPSP